METSVDEILKQEHDQSIQDMEDIDLSNLCKTSEEEGEIDEFKESEKIVHKFTETLFPVSKNNQKNNSLTNATLFNIRYTLENKADICCPNDLQLSINNNFLFDKLYEYDKFELTLDYQKFNTNYHEINLLLAKDGYFFGEFLN